MRGEMKLTPHGIASGAGIVNQRRSYTILRAASSQTAGPLWKYE